MLYINNDGKTEFTDENINEENKYENIYDISEDINYTGLDTIRLFPEDKDLGLEVKVNGNISSGILNVIPQSLTYVNRLSNEEDGSIIISKEDNKLIKKISFTRGPSEYRKILREIKSSSMDSTTIRISSNQKKLTHEKEQIDKSRQQLIEYRQKLAAIQRTLEDHKS